jgi:RNA polymerase sigma-70 factor (ECF subfamily)
VGEVADPLFAVAYRMLRDAALAQDVVQVTLLTAWRKLPGLRDPERFESWTYRILVSVSREEAGRRRRWESQVTQLVGEGPWAADGSQRVEDRDQIERLFRGLSADHRAVFVLHHYRGLSLVEIGALLGIPAGTARSRLHYATRVLRAALLDDPSPGVPTAQTI